MNKTTKNTLVEMALVVALTAAVMTSCEEAQAGTDLVVSGFSHHLTYGEYDQFNPGLGIFHDVTSNTAVVAGTYHNSYGKQTVYGGVSAHVAGRGALQARIDFMLATGYQDDVIPAVVPVIEFTTGPVTTRALLIPRVSEDTATAIGFQFRIGL